MDDEPDVALGPGPLKLLGRYALGLSLGVAAGSSLLPLAASGEPGNGSSGLGAWGWILALLTITLGGVAIMLTWAVLSGWLDTRATRRRGARGRRRRAPRSTQPRQVPYWLQFASTIVGMVTGIVGMVIGLAS